MTTEELVKEILEKEFEFDVEKIPECAEKTPDFLATSGKEKYFIEVKEKGSNPELIKAKKSALDDGQLFEVAESIQPKSVLENIVRSGKKQIEIHVDDSSSFRILWIHCIGIAYDATKDQIEAGLYGTETVCDFSDAEATSKLCYYFRESQFYKYREKIDAVIVSTKNGEGELYLNNYSPRFEDIRVSALAAKFGSGTRDPISLVEAGNAYIIDAPLDRSNRDHVLAHLKAEIGSDKLQIINMKHFEAHVAVPGNEM